MEEKQIIKNQETNFNFFALALAIIGVIFLILTLILSSWGFDKYGVIGAAFESGDSTFTLIAFLLFTVAAVLAFFAMRACELIVTSKRVYGKALFGKRVDLPLDMISSVGSGWFGCVSVATSSGIIRFYLLKNRDEIFSAITKLLLERQNNSKQTSTQAEKGCAAELKDLKQLLEDGIITEEEFNAKKKELLGL